MRASTILCGISLLLLGAGKSATAQVDISAWPQVSMEVLALDAQGDPVAGLSPQAIIVREGRQPHIITALAPAAGPQSICVLVDASNFMADRLDTMLTKAKRLLQRLPSQDEVCLAHYADNFSVDQKLTPDHRAAIHALASVTPSGQAHLRDALLQLSGYMRQSANNKSRVILLFSDGTDHGSASSKNQWRRGTEQEGTPVVHMICMPIAFGHALRKQGDETRGDALHITQVSGGITYFPHTIGEFDAMVDHLSDYLQSRYVLTYDAENSARDGRERRLSIWYGPAHREPNVILHAPIGYIAPSQ